MDGSKPFTLAAHVGLKLRQCFEEWSGAMDDEEAGTPHLRPVTIPAETLAAWRSIAKSLGARGAGLRLELADFERDNSWWMLMRAGQAATYAAGVVEDDLKPVAIALADEIKSALEAA